MPTEFQQRVYDALCEVPAGRVVSYGLLADRIGVRSAQAVGQALRRNPDAPRIPCHRVLRQDGYIGGYLGQIEQDGTKATLLRHEGVEFDAQGYLTDPTTWWSW